MANPSFVDALSALRRRAQLSGRPLTKQETSGAVAGYANTASERLARGRQLELQQQGLEQQKELEQERLALARDTQQKEYDIAKKQMKRDTMAGIIGTAGTGAAIGGSVAGAPGAVIGGAAGLIVGLVTKGCIIISACTDPQSYEVDIARLYRDEYMTPFELIGYYTIAAKIAPYMERYSPLKRLIKAQLVDRLVDYAEWLFGLKPAMKNPVLSKFIKNSFLNLCYQVGKYQFYRKGVVYDA